MRSFVQAMAIAAIAGVVSWIPAKAAECVVDAYKAYLFATQEATTWQDRELQFICTPRRSRHEVRFKADPAGGLRCAGKTPDETAGPFPYRAELFATPGATISLNNGWRIVGYDVDDGAVTKARDQKTAPKRRDSLILLDFEVPGKATAFRRGIRSITFSKPGGACANVLAESFNWPK